MPSEMTDTIVFGARAPACVASSFFMNAAKSGTYPLTEAGKSSLPSTKTSKPD
jgi:hypothetical protein